MKRVLCFILAVLMALTLAACVDDDITPVTSAGPSNSSASPASSSSIESEASSSESSETVSSATSSESSVEVTVDETVLVDENDIRITLKGLENSIWGPEFKILIENNSDTDITVQTRNCSINGYMVEAMLSCDVAAGKKANDSITFFETDLSANDITDIADLEFSFHIFNSDTWMDVYTSETLQIRTSIADGFTYTYDDSGEVLYDEDGVRIIVKGLSEYDSIFGPGLLLYIENTGAEPITVQARDTSVNGFMIDGLLSQDVLPGKRANTAVTFFESDLDENEIESFEELEISFTIINSEYWNTIADTEKYTITF